MLFYNICKKILEIKRKNKKKKNNYIKTFSLIIYMY